MKRILVVNVNWLGDVIFSSPVFRALRQHNPDAHIACMAVPRVKEILECIQEIDEIIEYDEEGQHKSIWSKLKFVGDLKRKRFDEAFFLSRSFSRVLMIALANIRQRIGYDHKNRGKFLTHIVDKPADGIHRSEYYLNVIKSYGITVNDAQTVLSVPPKEESGIQKMFETQGIQSSDYVIALNPGGNWGLKRWPAQNFSRLIDILNTNKNAKLLITGSDKDTALVNQICSNLQTSNVPMIFTGKLSLKQLLALLKKVNLFISADSGPLHMASSVGCSCIAIFGPTRPELTGPRGKIDPIILQKEVGCNKKACYFLECEDNTCMQAVTAEDVYAAVRQVQNS
ncbi:MAG: lipopolysaccharide heptosyltransferase II [Candidatus Omnitrophica bacterium]|nr:lipopolysaccharide heptosyltransferase II [Candidatus Omnitrophota bacterium]